MDILHLFSQSPLRPAYAAPPADGPVSAEGPGPMGYVGFEGGLVEIGHGGPGFAFDNEGPRHKTFVAPFSLGDRLVTNGEWLAFMADGGYQRHELWLSDGWAKVKSEGWRSPFYWRDDDGVWSEHTLHGTHPVDPGLPATHVSHYEADAYATWRGMRLPTEPEWEHAVVSDAAQPAPDQGAAPALHATSAGPATGHLRQVHGDAWQWTSSAYLPYPGFSAPDGAIGEYNGKFMSNQMVLRGGACITPDGHTRATYRNFFPPGSRWAFGGVRLAADA